VKEKAMSLLSNVFGKKTRTIRKASKRPTALRPWLEQLEDRTVPTVIFNPIEDGSEVWLNNKGLMSPSQLASNNTDALQSPKIYLIFAGPNWGTDQDPGAVTTAMIFGASSIVHSQYLSALTQYGSDGKATIAGWHIDPTLDDSKTNPNQSDGAPTGSSPDPKNVTAADPWWHYYSGLGKWSDNPSPFEEERVLGDSNFSSWLPPNGATDASSSPIYVVVRYNGSGGGGGSNSNGPDGATSLPINYVDISLNTTMSQPTDSNTFRIAVDTFTRTFSHEIAERISQGIGDNYSSGVAGITYVAAKLTNSPTQVGDGEPDAGAYTYRVNGALVQAIWSVQDQAFVVPNGSQQNIVLDPVWNDTVKNPNNRYTGFAVSLQHGNLYSIPTQLFTNASPSLQFSLIESNVQSYVLDKAGDVFYLTNGGRVKEWNASGKVTALTDSSLTVTSLARTNPFLFNGDTWILAHKDGQPNQLFEYGGSPNSWIAQSGAPRNLSALVSDGNTIYVLGNNGGANRVWNRDLFGNWTAITGRQTAIQQLTASLGPSSRIYILAQNPGQPNLVYQYSGSGSDWGNGISGQPAQVWQIAPAYHGIYVDAASSGLGGQVFRYWDVHSGSETLDGKGNVIATIGPEVGSWTTITEGNNNMIVNQIATAGYDLYMEGFNPNVDHDSTGALYPQVYQYSGEGTNWNHLTQVPTSVAQFEADGSNLYMLANNGGDEQIWHYNGPGTNWDPLFADVIAPSNTVTSQTAHLRVIFADEGGDISLTYTWAVVSKPNGAHPLFSANGTNAAMDTTVTFDRPGNYTFQVTIQDPHGMSATSNVNVTVTFPNLVGETFHFTSDTIPGIVGTLQVQSEDAGTGSFIGVYVSELTGTTFLATGSISNKGPSAIGGENQAYNISFTGTTIPPIPFQLMSFSGTLHDNGASLRWADDMRGTLADDSLSLASVGTVDTAVASSSIVNGTSVNLGVLVGDTQPHGELSYTWSTTSAPNGAAPKFSANPGVNTTVTFDMAGNYSFAVTISNGVSYGVTRSVNVTVNQTFTSIALSPASLNILDGKGQIFIATAFDQFGKVISAPPSYSWSLAPGSFGTETPITGTSALYTAPSSGRGTDTIIASIGSVSGSATIHVLDGTTGITIGALEDPHLTLDGTFIKPSSSQRLVLTPGNHTLAALGLGGSVTFQVAANGIVSYDSSLEGILNGQGTDTLTVNGALVTINASALTDPSLVLDGYTPEQPGTFQAVLLPGEHKLQEYTAGSVTFTVNPNGTISVDDPNLVSAGILSSQGNQLIVNGATVTINAQSLVGGPTLYVDSYSNEQPGTFMVHVLPGAHLLQQGLFGRVSYNVDPSGNISFDSQYANFLSVQNGNQLIVKGAQVAIDATALGNTTVYLDYYTPEQTATVIFVNLLPGTQLLQIYSNGQWNPYQFTVTTQDTITFDPSLSNVFSLEGPLTLLVS
jgi:hypothetical protein